ncbi:hypothetical protein ACIRP7_36405 [Streptomyces sp. NPDC102270]|uniref:hypothetical protein n=1 Tax=Streptomyces sp. NPDC102270 TaxID=3366150 RepID=UPI00381431C9
MSFDGQWHHNDLIATGHPLNALGNPAGDAWHFDHQHVVYRGTDSHVHELRFDGRWHHNDLTGAATGHPLNATGDPVVYAYDVSGDPAAIYRGTDSHIHELRWEGGSGQQWVDDDLTDVTGPLGHPPNAAGDPAAVYHWSGDRVTT